MLIVSRRPDEIIEIRPREGIGAKTLDEVFAGGAIRVQFVRMSPSRVKVAIDAPPQIEIRRGESTALVTDSLERAADEPDGATDYERLRASR
jgi:sRNA-binding carbon storage regulator CsrA